MNDEDIKQWYADHALPYDSRAWGPRLDTGETALPEYSALANPGRDGALDGDKGYGARRVYGAQRNEVLPGNTTWLSAQYLAWLEENGLGTVYGAPREPEDTEYIHRLNAFFLPYVVQLPKRYEDVLRWVLNDHRTFREVGERLEISRQSAHKRFKRALKMLVWLVAQSDPDYVKGEEAEAAGRVLRGYLDGETQ